jgi:hypothetical protein
MEATEPTLGKGMNERCIIVLGMAHSATTTFTHILGQHPLIELLVPHDELLENTFLARRKPEDAQYVKDFCECRPEKFILMKRPQAEVDPAFFAEYFRDAHFYLLQRNRADVIASWSKATSNVGDDQRKDPERFYDWLSRAAADFPKLAKATRVRRIDHTDLQTTEKARAIFEQVGEDLRHPYAFDLSEIGQGNIKSKTRREVGGHEGTLGTC